MEDVTIIGGGPAGLFASFYSGLRGMSVRIMTCKINWVANANLSRKIIWDIGAWHLSHVTKLLKI